MIEVENRVVTTPLIRVAFDPNHCERITSLKYTGSGELTTKYGQNDHTGASYVPDGPSCANANSTPLLWDAKVLDEGRSATVTTRSQLAGCPVVETKYTFFDDQPMFIWERTFAFSDVNWDNRGHGGLMPYLCYARGTHIPFTYSRSPGAPGSGVTRDFPSAITDWDRRWTNTENIAYFYYDAGYPVVLYGDSDAGPSGSRVNPAFSDDAVLTTDRTVIGAIYLHPSGITPDQLDRQYQVFAETVPEPTTLGILATGLLAAAGLAIARHRCGA